ncbi:uncharacterized protein BJX67DRAFT_23885 [Aspergillus lucknowensis]|uniref:Uncharacterized protein n=1 Tax=Aspergillus lucknowensis TaxID=176173 RepID=A0ABR4M137_9EURO
MDPPSEKSGGEQSSGAPRSAGLSSPQHALDDRTPPPSARDILQPLSHSSPLPPSGHLAAVLRQKRRSTTGQHSQQENPNIWSPSSPRPSSEDRSSVESRTDRHRSSPPSGIESSPTQADDLSQATSPQTGRGAEEGHGFSDPPCSSETKSVQKRSREIQFLHDVDEEGVRTWKRCVIEYS